MTKIKIKKGDKVKVTVGKDKGREGTVEKILPKANRILVTGVNVYKKHSRTAKKGQNQAGGIIDIVVPLPCANVALICPKCGKPTRVGYQILKDGKVRICRKCKEVI